MQPVSFRATAIKPPALVSAAPLSGEHKQAWCVDYKYNPLIITERMEDFDEKRQEQALNSNCTMHAGCRYTKSTCVSIYPVYFLTTPFFLPIRKLH